MSLPAFLALVMLLTLIAYAVLAGADFGAGIWDLLSRGPRGAEHRRALAHAIGPVWEANHVWLIFFIVLLFTCFPVVYARVSIMLFWPLHLVLIGVVLRGVSFVFRAYASEREALKTLWGSIFGASSAITPVLLGMCVGAVSTGGAAWNARFPVITGILTLSICAYLAAVYLAWESGDRTVQEDFRRRALIAWAFAGACAGVALVLARSDAPRLWLALTSWPAVMLISAGALVAPLSFAALWQRRFGVARVLGATQVVVLLLGWGTAQWPYLIYPELTVGNAAAPMSTLRLTAATLPFGAAALIPSLWYLFAVFKKR